MRNRGKELERQEEELDAMLENQQDDGMMPNFAEETPTTTEAEETPAPVAADPWESKYKTLQGKYNADIARTRDELNQLKTQLAEATRKPAIDPNQTLRSGFEYLVEGDIEQGTQAVMPAIDAMVENALSRHMAPLQEQARATAMSSFQAELSHRLPNWQEIDNSPAFSEFLDNIEPISGVTYREIGAQVFPSMNMDRTLAIYNTFLATQGKPQASSREIPAHLVVPGRSSAPQPVKPAQGNVTREQVQYAEKQLRLGKITEEQFDKVFDAFQSQGAPGSPRFTNGGNKWNDPME